MFRFQNFFNKRIMSFFIIFLFLITKLGFSQNINCDHSINSSTTVVDGTDLIYPGDTVCLLAGQKDYLLLRNIHGTVEQPVVVLNKDGIIEKNGRTFVLLMPKNDDPPKPKPVKTAEYQGNEVRILSGLSEGEIVLSAGVLEQLSQNQQDKNPLQMLGLPGGGGRLMGGSPPGGKR